MKLVIEQLAQASSCCAAVAAEHKVPVVVPPPRQPQFEAKVQPIPGGIGLLGTDFPVIPADGEGPARRAELAPFYITETTISAEEFARFVEATGYVTDAERRGRSFVFQHQLAPDAQDLGGLMGTPWWRDTKGASWRNPNGSDAPGPQSPNLPVVHVSYTDAHAYASWVGGRLPIEGEWEHAARGGLGDVTYPWGEENPPEGGGNRCTIWQGAFPEATPGAAIGPKPVRAHAANGFGLYNMCGNVWEWTDDVFHNGVGPDPNRHVLKGGSYLCHPSYCFRYRIAARIGAARHATTSHQGFRVVFDDGAGFEH